MRRTHEVRSWSIHCEGWVSICAADMSIVLEWPIQSKHIEFVDASGYMRCTHEVRCWSIHCESWEAADMSVLLEWPIQIKHIQFVNASG